jgi:hypothetical protein
MVHLKQSGKTAQPSSSYLDRVAKQRGKVRFAAPEDRFSSGLNEDQAWK